MDISAVEVGQHFYWQIGGFLVHAQVLITSWVVIAILLVSAILVIRNLQTIPTFGQNLFEYVLEFIRDVSKTQIGEEYGPWVPFIGTLFLFIYDSKEEKIVDIQESRKNRFIVITQNDNKYLQYVIVKKDNKYLIDSKKRRFLNEDKWYVDYL